MKTKYKSLVLELVMKTMAVIGMVYFMNQAYQAYMNSHNPTVLLLLLEELITVFLIVAAKFTDTRNFSPLSMIATTCGTFYFFAVSLDSGTKLISDNVASIILICAICLQIYAKIYLGRSFGLLPACRTVVDTGPYRLVRHPIYLGYFVGHMSFLFNNFSLWNIIVFTLLYLFQFLRIIYEEQVLSQNEQYREYKTRVKYRFIPFII